MFFFTFSLNNDTGNIDPAQPSLSFNVYTACLIVRRFYEKIHRKSSYLSHRCWKISNQKEVKTRIVTSLKYAKENVPDCAYPNRHTEKH